MRRNGRNILLAVLISVFFYSTTMLLRQYMDNAGAEESYGDALAVAIQDSSQQVPLAAAPTEVREEKKTVWVPSPVEGDAETESLAAIDLDALREVNSDVMGWIYIPDTKINYPLMRGEDNEYYLKHAWDHRKTSVGSIFLEQNNNADLMDFNTILYGHNMNDGSMFAGLRKFSDQGYWEKHPYVYLVTEAGVYRYDIFAAYKAPVDSVAYGLSFREAQTKAEFLLYALENSKIQTGISPGGYDRILTLSTCSGAGYAHRWVVQARLKMVEAE